jgi:hypothetical protein
MTERAAPAVDPAGPADTATWWQPGRWFLIAFDKGSGGLAREYEVRAPEITAFRKAFGLSDDDPAIFSYDVTPDNRAFVQELVAAPIDLDRYDYQVEQGRI